MVQKWQKVMQSSTHCPVHMGDLKLDSLLECQNVFSSKEQKEI